MEDYRAYIAENGLKPVIAVDTHIHADHFSATHLFRTKYSVEVGMSALTASARATRKFNHGDRFEVGSLVFEVLETPGHTVDSVSYFGEGMVFTGDTLFISSSGRTDFPGADPALQWKSIHEVLGKLPGETLVFPAHDYNDMIFSTIQTEKRKNPHWLIPSLEEFVAMKRAEQIPSPSAEIMKRLTFNRDAHPSIDVSQNAGGVTASAP